MRVRMKLITAEGMKSEMY